MTPTDIQHFITRLVTLGELFDVRMSEAKQELYFDALADLPLDIVVKAMNLAARTCTFMPRPAELRRLVKGGEEETELAWREYQRVARQVGGYESPTFADGALAATLVAVFGSWEQACWVDLSPEMWASKRKEFERVYRVLCDRGVTGPVQLDGFIAKDRQLRGYAPSLRLEGQQPDGLSES
jgi:hypothetical protein